MLNGYKASIKKEFLLISRDVHTLLVLFVMPMIFILIMSLAMRDAFSKDSAVLIDGAISIEQSNKLTNDFMKNLLSDDGFKWQKVSNIQKAMMDKNLMVGVEVKKDFGKDGVHIDVYFNREVNPSVMVLLKQSIIKASTSVTMVETIERLNPWLSMEEKVDIAKEKKIFNEHYIGNEQKRPTSVQQSVPAWLIFSMFFIIIPISNTFINERNSGTLSRLAVMNISSSKLLLSKIIPYALINQIQFVLMLIVGIYIVPIFGGDSLDIGGHYLLLAIVGFVLSFATISYALALATMVKTAEQATTIGGLMNIIFAAIGGVMVPLFIMPSLMQNLANISPMSWGLDAFMAIFLHDGNTTHLTMPLVWLSAFGAAMLLIAWYRLNKEIKDTI
jgi:ABC-2 type transport system permease protein